MALQDILAAITAEAEQQITELQAAHKQRTKDMKHEHEQAVTAMLRHVKQDKDQKKHQMRTRAEAQVHMVVSHALLRRKQELLDEFYGRVVEALNKLPADTLQKFFASCIASIKDQGVIHAAPAHEALLKKLAPAAQFTFGEAAKASGGFRFVGKHEDRDYTFEFLVNQVLRPENEIEIAQKLFSA